MCTGMEEWESVATVEGVFVGPVISKEREEKKYRSHA